MLTPEEAKEALARVHVPRAKARRMERLRKLPEALRVAGENLLKCLAQKYDEAKTTALLEVAAIHLRNAAPEQRIRCFEALFPSLGAHVEACWQADVYRPLKVHHHIPCREAVPSDYALCRQFAQLVELLEAVEGFEQPAEWLAAWGARLVRDKEIFPGYVRADLADPWSIGNLLAAVIDSGGATGDAVFSILCDSLAGVHEIGIVGHHAILALLVASRPAGWAAVERLLLAAQREEGLRQSILGCLTEAHPQALQRMLRVILDHDLYRFSSVVQAMNDWFGMQWDSAATKPIRLALERLLKYLQDAKAREQAYRKGDGEECYLTLWALSTSDVAAAIEAAASLLKDQRVERRFAAVTFLGQLDLEESRVAGLPAMEDEDLRVVARYLGRLYEITDELRDCGVWDATVRLLKRLPTKKQAAAPLVWPWCAYPLDRYLASEVLALQLATRRADEVKASLPYLQPNHRASVANRLSDAKKPNKEQQSILLILLGDSSKYVRECALTGLAKVKLSPADAPEMEALLAREAPDLRQAALKMLLSQKDADALASSERLCASGHPAQRRAGAELLRLLGDAKRTSPKDAKPARPLNKRTKGPDEERQDLQLDAAPPEVEISRSTALGLIDPAQRTRPAAPQKRPIQLASTAAINLLKSLDGVVREYGEAPVRTEVWGSTKDMLLSSDYSIPFVPGDKTWEEALAMLPLRDVWEKWGRDRAPDTRDADGLELIRAWALHEGAYVGDGPDLSELRSWAKRNRPCPRRGQLRYPDHVGRLLPWLLRMYPPAGAATFLLDAVETAFAAIPSKTLEKAAEYYGRLNASYRDRIDLDEHRAWSECAHEYRGMRPDNYSTAQHCRYWRLLRWAQDMGVGDALGSPSLKDTLVAWKSGDATDADMFLQLVGPRKTDWTGRFHELTKLSRRKPPQEVLENPKLGDIVARIRARILEVELARGDSETVATLPALDLSALEGAETLYRLIEALGCVRLRRRGSGHDKSKPGTLSHLIGICHPGANDTPAAFAAEARKRRLKPQRLIEVAILAPQWAAHVEAALGWAGFAESVWWLHAHTKERHSWNVPEDNSDVWAAQISQRTPLSAEELLDGAVDVAWFQQLVAQLGKARWKEVHAAGRFASSGIGHARAQLFADAMLGDATRSALAKRIAGKRNQDAVRALGLLPLPKGKNQKAEILERYALIQEFVRTCRQFGPQRQASEKRAAEIGLENLARTAGYPDPLRLQWAMEQAALADLAGGKKLVARSGDYAVSLALDDDGAADVTITRGNKMLKALPPAVKKTQPALAELLERRTELRRQTARIRASLEQAMCRGDAFSGAELRTLAGHPLLYPMLSRLVLVGEGIMGYPHDAGRALRDHAGRLEPVKPAERLRIAHPHDLLEGRAWHLWQRECFQAERVQPFKQVFRELYVGTPAEQGKTNQSTRYAGHQVYPRQALAVLGKRGWVYHPDEGLHRTFHHENLIAGIAFDCYFTTPAEVEGVTVCGVVFARRKDHELLPLAEVPPRLFSEAMRDVDLMVSVAHRGGVNPEACESTVEMRASLVRESATWLHLDNVRTQDHHVLIAGRLGEYSVHLGSGVVHRLPGGHLCIVPVHAQHRGRLFLPFADDDPKTAEVLSKVLLLARDEEIRDPQILEQLQRMA